MTPAVLVFDVDNTLTPPRAPLPQAMGRTLMQVALPFHLAAGSDLQLVREQVITPLADFGFVGTFDAFVCNGADRYRCVFSKGSVSVHPLFRFELRRHLGDEAYGRLWERLAELLREPEFLLDNTDIAVCGPQIIDRQSMINVAPMGRPQRMSQEAYMQRARFVEFDRRTGYRLRLLERLRAVVAPWVESHGLRVTLGGQTSFDIVVEGYDKRYPLQALLAEGAQSIFYFGDALHAEGNDRAVLEFIAKWKNPGPCPVHAFNVNNWEDTYRMLFELGVVRTLAGRQGAS